MGVTTCARWLRPVRGKKGYPIRSDVASARSPIRYEKTPEAARSGRGYYRIGLKLGGVLSVRRTLSVDALGDDDGVDDRPDMDYPAQEDEP